jgi:TPR repeat protein
MKGLLVLPIIYFLLIGAPALADFDDGLDAYDKGDYSTALKVWKPLAESGDLDAQVLLGEMYLVGTGVNQDYKAAFKWFKLAAEQGYTPSQTRLGIMLYYGRDGIPRDYKAAFKWFKLASEWWDSTAQFHLGLIYDEGHGVTQDYKTALSGTS